jgi:hypothetical protein
MKFAYEDLSDNQFEDLVIFLCKRLLGISVQGFSDGPDGGRDAKFVGTAELHPSTAKTLDWHGNYPGKAHEWIQPTFFGFGFFQHGGKEYSDRERDPSN